MSCGEVWSTTDIYRRLEMGGYINRGMTASVVNRIEETLQRLGCERAHGYMWTNKKIQSEVVYNDAVHNVIQHGKLNLGMYL